uniref:Dynein heavy chain tail domain-containing protein n=1 Tax=Timema poppense TaxID=170557 RepID=A0A7R9D2Q6_TIMPO|nr:unnamed protein product [Timema poppensis]
MSYSQALSPVRTCQQFNSPARSVVVVIYELFTSVATGAYLSAVQQPAQKLLLSSMSYSQALSPVRTCQQFNSPPRSVVVVIYELFTSVATGAYLSSVQQPSQNALQVKPSTSRGAQAVVPKVQAVPVGPPKKKLFLTDGWKVPLTGICIYMFRLNTGKQLPEEGFHKDLYCGIIDAENVGLVTSIERIMEHVFMEALAHPAPDAEEDDANNPTVKNQLLPGLRSFCSALKVCEEVCDEPNLFEDGLGFMANIHTLDEVRELVKQPERLTGLEERVKAWIRKVQEVIMESQQLRKENDSSGPQDELEYWKKRGAQFSQIVSHLQCHENPPPTVTLVSPPQVQMTLQCLHVARSKMIKHWRDTDRHITFCYNESRDNAKFIQSMEKCCHSLYLHDPVRIKDSIMGLLQTVRLIHSVSQYYNTSERTSSLMVKVSVGRTAETDRLP